jgi:hypothetical protein
MGQFRRYQVLLYLHKKKSGVVFINGVSHMEMFSKSDQSEISANEIEALLKANDAGEWKAEGTAKAKWRRWQIQAVARWSK